jgi:hypothetical protein
LEARATLLDFILFLKYWYYYKNIIFTEWLPRGTVKNSYTSLPKEARKLGRVSIRIFGILSDFPEIT